MKKTIALIIGATLLTSGCSTIVNGTTQKLAVNTSPKEATIRLISANGATIQQNEGNLYYDLKRGNGYFSGASYTLEISMDCYETQIISIDSTVSGWYAGGNLLFGGLIGYLILDPATGGMWAMEASNNQELESLTVVLLKDASEEIMAKAVKIK